MLGITLKEKILAPELTVLDQVSYYSAYVTLITGSIFLVLTFWITLVSARNLVKSHRAYLLSKKFAREAAAQMEKEEDEKAS